jgi:hypothetical protein
VLAGEVFPGQAKFGEDILPGETLFAAVERGSSGKYAEAIFLRYRFAAGGRRYGARVTGASNRNSRKRTAAPI